MVVAQRVAVSDIVEWVCDEMYQRITAKKDAGEAAAEVMALVVKLDCADDLLKDGRGEWLISNLFARYARALRGDREEEEEEEATPLTDRADSETDAPAEARQPDRLAALRKSSFYAPINVGRKWIPQGEMRREDWLRKSAEYDLTVQNAAKRSSACKAIAARVTEGRTTQECLSPTEFRQLLPDIGL